MYEKIIAEKPIWWQFINSDNDFYVEIRKGNVIDVYYRGGRVAQISFKKGVFVATAHPKYTADNVSKMILDIIRTQRMQSIKNV